MARGSASGFGAAGRVSGVLGASCVTAPLATITLTLLPLGGLLGLPLRRGGLG
jgi:hypothetical protein